MELPGKATNIRSLTVQWMEITGGIDFTSIKVKEPLMHISALRIDLSDPAVSIIVGPEPLDFGIVGSIKTTSFARKYDCIAAVNANPFEPSSTVEGEDRRIVGIAMYQGKLMADADSRYAALVFNRDGTAEVLEQKVLSYPEYITAKAIDAAVGGFFIVLQAGLPRGDGKVRHPRTAAGVSNDGKTLYLLVIDGRSFSSVGATEVETGFILAALGATEGLILDGGGSTTMAMRYADGSLRPVNKPRRMILLPSQQRAVAICLGIAYDRSR